MRRDYDRLLPRVLDALFPDERARRSMEEVLARYGEEPWQRETSRVRLGILRISGDNPRKIASATELACQDYRDLLVAAEYPLSFDQWRLRESDPARYRELQEREAREYDAWLAATLGR